MTEDEVLAAVPKQLLIGGCWVDAADGATLEVTDPATGTTIAVVGDATIGDAQAALRAADDAFPGLARMAPRERGDILRGVHEAMLDQAEALALLVTLETGKPLAEARDEVAYAAAYLRWYAEEAVRINGRHTRREDGVGRVLTTRRPVGPCLLITPWNFPLAMGARKLGPAIATGCTAVVKPAEQTPLSMLMLARLFEDAGLPAGALNIIISSSPATTMAPLIGDPRLRKLSFTGSTPVGRTLIAQSAEQVLRVSMELGGNAAFLVFADADIDAAVAGALVAKMRNAGQACTAANRFYVHDAVAEEFTAKLVEQLAALKVGRGTEAGVQVGPLIDAAQRVKVTALVDDAVGRGATVLCGGSPVDGAGTFYAPTVLTDVAARSRLLAEEIFGPVAPVVAFATDDEAIDAANATEYGLAAYVFTKHINRAFEVAERLQTGMVGLNQGTVSAAGAPFGGVKQSGLGREGGPEGLDEYLETQYLAIGA